MFSRTRGAKTSHATTTGFVRRTGECNLTGARDNNNNNNNTIEKSEKLKKNKQTVRNHNENQTLINISRTLLFIRSIAMDRIKKY